MTTTQRSPDTRRRALVADDDPAVRAFLTDFLEQQDLEVHATPDGRSALEAFRAEHFDFILVDFQMPRITGVEMATEVRKADPHIPIALLTGTANAIELGAVARAGIDRTFQKPFRLDELSSWIKSLPL